MDKLPFLGTSAADCHWSIGVSHAGVCKSGYRHGRSPVGGEWQIRIITSQTSEIIMFSYKCGLLGRPPSDQ